MDSLTTCILCGAPVRIPENADTVTCPLCQTVMDVVRPEPEEASPAAPAQPAPSRPDACILCGAPVRIPKDADTVTCPYCQTVMDVVPFKQD